MTSEIKFKEAEIKFVLEEREDDINHKNRITNGQILFSWSGSPDTSIDIFLWTGGERWLNQHTFRVVSFT